MRRLTHERIPAKWILSQISPGKRLRLRDDVYRHVKQREWILDKIDLEGVHLLHESKAYGLIVGIEEIDWSEFEIRLPKGQKGHLSEERFKNPLKR